MAVVSAVVAVVSLGVSLDAQKTQQREAERQRNIGNASSASDRARARRQQVREQRVKRAQIEQAAANTGVAGSSGELAGVGALSTDFAVNEGYIRQSESLGQALGASRARAGKAAVQGQVGAAIGQLGQVAGSLDGIFSGTKAAPKAGATDGTNDTMGYMK
jgi:hypothetical protein